MLIVISGFAEHGVSASSGVLIRTRLKLRLQCMYLIQYRYQRLQLKHTDGKGLFALLPECGPDCPRARRLYKLSFFMSRSDDHRMSSHSWITFPLFDTDKKEDGASAHRAL